MAKEVKDDSVKPEPKPFRRVPEQRTVPVAESERLQKEGFVVVGITRKDGVKVHILEKR